MSENNYSTTQTPKSQGKVFIIGAGPGEHNYLTVMGQNLLAQADVILYDALINPELLNLVKKTCLKIPVGKRGKGPSTPQTDIDRRLVAYCCQGYQVVRLKSGDPFVFGRTTSEVLALHAAGCAVEVLPGISSALAAPLFAGIPLTDAQLGQHFTVLSAHAPERLDWSVLAQLDTLVILMGARHLENIVHHLRHNGQPEQHPIAIIRWGGRRQQQVWTGTLGTIVAQTQGESLSPCVIVVGKVVHLQPTLGLSFPTNSEYAHRSDSAQCSMGATSLQSILPLAGKTILVTRAVAQSKTFSQSLISMGATVVDMPALEIGPPSSWEALDDAIASLDHFDWLILTSANGVTRFLDRLFHAGLDTRALASVKIAVVGRKTAKTLEQQGLKADYIPPNFVADALVEHFPGETLTGQTLLFPRVESGGRDVLVKQLTQKGATVVEVAAYQSRCPATIAPQALQALQTQTVDIVTFASSKTVRYFYQLLQQAVGEGKPQAWLTPLKVASIGPQTSLTCQELLGRVDIEAEEYTLDGLTQSIVDHYQTQD
ncbi:uroporphyrinogen-III C-methyltransferase [Acaryochloris sp. CCMEE 5410]|uniref:uroporphyrinogen-III C-methyltransferase n=1 Tax=Acaryochloris sp. CCMEE 5410 TaxID=310037 RepID=UPI0002483B12|nr:uroporphyrinogen-III C-methyltransferase [Acaryochloris sp. CCMEE 5410]KAI9133267.1 uroporphyrinogen-III C-methyltransferase [Acaryochloris sp. CCMEE 5410]